VDLPVPDFLYGARLGALLPQSLAEARPGQPPAPECLTGGSMYFLRNITITSLSHE